jgi:hypothetical protein
VHGGTHQHTLITHEPNRLYLDNDLCDKLVDFHDIILNKMEPVEGYFYESFSRMTKEEILEKYGDNLAERADQVLEHVADNRRALETEFRRLLGIQDNVNNKKKGISNVGDLMWVPQPAIIDPIQWPQQPEGHIAGAGEQHTPPPCPPEPIIPGAPVDPVAAPRGYDRT